MKIMIRMTNDYTKEEKELLKLDDKKLGSPVSHHLPSGESERSLFTLLKEKDPLFSEEFFSRPDLNALFAQIEELPWISFSLDGLNGLEWEIAQLEGVPHTLLIRALFPEKLSDVHFIEKGNQATQPLFLKDFLLIPDIRKNTPLTFYLSSGDGLLLDFQEETLLAVPILNEQFFDDSESPSHPLEIPEEWRELLEQDPEFKRWIAPLWESGLLWSTTVAIGRMARLLELTPEEQKRWMQAQFSGEKHPFDALWSWGEKLSLEQQEELIERAELKIQSLYEAILDMENNGHSDNELLLLLHQRDELENILWVLDKTPKEELAEDFDYLMQRVKTLDEEGERFILSQAYSPKISEDTYLQRVAQIQPEAWWVHDLIEQDPLAELLESLDELETSTIKETLVNFAQKQAHNLLDFFEKIFPSIPLQSSVALAASKSDMELDVAHGKHFTFIYDEDGPNTYKLFFYPNQELVGKHVIIEYKDLSTEIENLKVEPLGTFTEENKIDILELSQHLKIKVIEDA